MRVRASNERACCPASRRRFSSAAPLLRAVTVVLLSLSATACGGLFGDKERSPLAVYVLSIDPREAPPQPGGCGILEVSMPDPAPGFGTARMLYQREAHRLEAFAYARWAEPPAQMVQEVLVAALQSSGMFASVLAAPAAVPPDLSLDSDGFSLIQRFDGGASRSELSISVRLVDRRASKLLAVRRLSVTVDAEPNPAGGVKAANRALEEVVGQLLETARGVLDCAGNAGAAQG
jgi:cholesterol transport system auxiliary component